MKRKQAYLSMSDLFYRTASHTDFERLKTGYVGHAPDGSKYEIVEGIPKDARLHCVIYLFDSNDVPEVDDPFEHPSLTIKSRRIKE